MLWVAAAMLAVWFGGTRLGLPAGMRLASVGLIWLGVLGLLWSRPGSLGGTASEWVLVGLLGVAVWGYGRVLARLRSMARPAEAPAAGAFSAAELERYSRHILLREIGGPGQKRLKAAKVLVVGAGGLGAPVLQYLAAAGVGTIGVIDDDVVDASNLHRQVIHPDAALGMPKVHSAARAIAAQNPFVTVRPYLRRLDEAIAAELIADYDLVLDGSDNFDTRYLVNRACARLGKPLLAGALTQWEGQLSLWDPKSGAPCYECVFPERPADGLVPACSVAGVAGPLPGVIGSMMALEAVKEIVGAGESLRGKLVIYDGLGSEWRSIRVKRRDGCAACGAPA
jgi:molybdopterin/thiamine biosynthesis adenylyltransferase